MAEMAGVSVPQGALFDLGFFYRGIQKEGSRTNSFLKVFISSVQIDSGQRVSTSQKKYKRKVPEQTAS